MPIQIDDGVRKRKRRARQKKDRRAKLTEDGTGGGQDGEKLRKWSAGRKPEPEPQTESRAGRSEGAIGGGQESRRAGRLEDAMGRGRDGKELRKWRAG